MGRFPKPGPAKTRRVRSSPTESRGDGIRIQLKGQRTIKELRAMLFEAIGQLEEHGVIHVRGCNLYVTPLDEKGTPLTRFPGLRGMPSIVIEEPYRSAADEQGL
mgnify:CR=1 FL=1